jgi:hypothetical protein
MAFGGEAGEDGETESSGAGPGGNWQQFNWERPDNLRAFFPFYNMQHYLVCTPSTELVRWLAEPSSSAAFRRERDGFDASASGGTVNIHCMPHFLNPIEMAHEQWLSWYGELDHPDFGRLAREDQGAP